MKALAINDKILKAAIVSTSLIPTISFGSLPTDCQPVGNGDSGLTLNNGANCARGQSNSKQLFGSAGVFHTIADVLIYIVGAVAVIMLIIGGLRYVISQGSKEGVTQAKDTILYAIIGIVVAILAYAIVNFISGSIGNSNSNPAGG